MQLLKYKFEGPDTQQWTRAPLCRKWAPHKTIRPSVKMFANDIIKLRVMVLERFKAQNFPCLDESGGRTSRLLGSRLLPLEPQESSSLLLLSSLSMHIPLRLYPFE